VVAAALAWCLPIVDQNLVGLERLGDSAVLDFDVHLLFPHPELNRIEADFLHTRIIFWLHMVDPHWEKRTTIFEGTHLQLLGSLCVLCCAKCQ